MISVIICSADPGCLETVSRNIEETIGTPFEIIATDNRFEQRGICKVYNDAAAKAQFDILCFLHEDIILHANNWGSVLTELFKDESIGLAGISGAVYKSRYPGTWSACDQKLYRTHSVQHFNREEAAVISNINPEGVCAAEVAVIDGVFMATKKNVFRQFKFDEAMLTGFHGYDIDLSLEVGTKYRVVVTYGILLEHFSAGQLNKEWLTSSFKVHDKWKAALPKEAGTTGPVDRRLNDYISIQNVLGTMIHTGTRPFLVIRYYFKLITGYFKLNGLKYTKTVIMFFIRKIFHKSSTAGAL